MHRPRIDLEHIFDGLAAGDPRRRSRVDGAGCVEADQMPPSGRPAQQRVSRRRRRTRPTPEEQAYREARRRANARLSFYTHLIVYGSVIALILVASRSIRAAMVVALAWGIGIAVHYFVALVAPDLRRRLIDDEVGRRVADDVGRERRAIETRHVRSMESLSASIAHELRNPITAAKSLVQQMGEDPVSGDNIEYAKVALEELDRVERSISHLLRFARDEEMHTGSFRMEDVIDSALETFRDRIQRTGVELQREIDCPGTMHGDAEKVRRALINLMGNALDAFEEAGTQGPRLEVTAGENLAGSEVWVRVRDNGPGIPPDVLERIFSPFYTTKREGTGLGLALSKKVVEAHGGSIEAESTPGAGSEFLLTFPKQPGNGEEVR
jgi:signal transduction histidine kinase